MDKDSTESYESSTRKIHGEVLSNKFLDDLFTAICDKVPLDKWVVIQKDVDRVVAGVKYLIDNNMYGREFSLELSNDFKSFKKIEHVR